MTQLLVSTALATGVLALVVREVLLDHGSVVRAVDPDRTRAAVDQGEGIPARRG